MQHYHLADINKVGKIDSFVPYIYDAQSGWRIDNENLLMDRLMGYDGETIGNGAELSKIDEITKEQADKIIKSIDAK